MTGKLISEAVGGISARHIEEAADFRAKKKNPHLVKWGALAACFAIIVIATATFFPRTAPPEPTPPPSGPASPGSDAPAIDPPASLPPVALDNIVLNSIEEMVSAAPKWYDPELYDTITWTQEEITAYFGRDIIPSYTPQVMTDVGIASDAVVEKGGVIVRDTVHIIYRSAEDSLDAPYMSIAVSKLGLLNDCIYLLPENEVRASDIGGTPVTIGYRAMPHGPYDPETKEPAGYYDLYVANFALGDVEYEIVAERMALEEVVRTAASVINSAVS